MSISSFENQILLIALQTFRESCNTLPTWNYHHDAENFNMKILKSTSGNNLHTQNSFSSRFRLLPPSPTWLYLWRRRKMFHYVYPVFRGAKIHFKRMRERDEKWTAYVNGILHGCGIWHRVVGSNGWCGTCSNIFFWTQLEILIWRFYYSIFFLCHSRK